MIEESINVINEIEDTINLVNEEEQSISLSTESINVVSGTTNYEKLKNKPQINNIELIGNKTSEELGLQEEGNYANTRVTNLEIDELFR